jgi:hypothetical protein
MEKQTFPDIDKYGAIGGMSIFMTLCCFNTPLAFVYTTLFMYFYSIKGTNYDAFYNFIITSLAILGYVLILGTALYLVEFFGGIPRDNRFPLFYQL